MKLEMRFKTYAEDGLDVIKANALSALVAGVLLAVPIVNMVALVNFLRGVKASRKEGRPIDPASLFGTDNAANIVVALCIGAVLAVASSVLVVGPILVSAALVFSPCLLADKPGLGWGPALQGSLSFALKNPLDMLVLAVLAGVAAFVGSLLCGIGFVITGPFGAALTWMAYDANRAAVETTSAARGVVL